MTEAGSGGQPRGAQILAGRYRLEERIGVGAMGEVWRAGDLRLQRDVAVKRIRLDGHVDAASQARFRREAVAMAGVSHPNVVSVYDAGTDAGDGRIAYLVMELLDGPSCADLMAQGRSLSLGEVERIGAGVARGLAAAHAAGVVHRDIKPSNVVVSRGVPKIVDFGIARLEQEATSTLTAPQTTIGTAAYMSPEQALGKPVGPASDVYSLGALLIALASGSPPFGASNALALMRAHVDDAPPSLADLRDDAPPQLAALLDRMLAKAPAVRPTASEVAHVLEGGELPTESGAAAAAAAAAVATRVTTPVSEADAPSAPVAPAPSAPLPSAPVPSAPVPSAPAEPDGRRRGGALWWLVAAALLVLGLVIATDALRDPDEGGAPDGPATTVTPTGSTVTQVVTPTREATTEPVTPTETVGPTEQEAPTEPDETTPDGGETGDAGENDLTAAVAAAGAAIDGVADDTARADLAQLWQPASRGLQGANGADRVREVQQEADALLGQGRLTGAERNAVTAALEDVIALL